MPVSPPSPAETVIAERYELKRRLAQGGMAEVWLAIDLTLDRKVAVKWLKPMLASDEIVAERFRREAIAAASLNHPNIVAVHDVFEHEGRQAVVMQLVDGKSLRQLLDTQKRLSPELTCHIGTCVAAALENAHENNFVHRDVKPGNIMITPDGRVLLTDFGIAKALAGNGDDDLTSDNIMMGTAKYLSPEQVRGKKLDGRADLYSLGLVLYECLAGRVPFLGESDADTALARLQRDPTDLNRLRATLPTGLVTVIHQLLARNPAHRPGSGSELIEALEAAVAEGPPVIDDTPHEHSPVAPFAAGRMRRAASDFGGRADDRRRATRPASPPSGIERQRQEPPTTASRPSEQVSGQNRDLALQDTAAHRRIPGEPERIGGAVAVIGNAPPVDRPRRDHTPSAGAGLRGEPARGMAQGWKPSVTVIGALLALALVVAVVLWMSVRFGAGDSSAPAAVLPTDVTSAQGAQLDEQDPPVGDTASVGAAINPETDALAGDASPLLIERIQAYDPDGDGIENNDRAANAIDGDSSTNWRTVCYSGQYMGGKGVGLVISLDSPGQQALRVNVENGPFQLEFHTATSESVPASLDGWEKLGDRAFASDGEIVTSETPPAAVRHMLALFIEIGPAAGCSDTNPFRGSLNNIELMP